jgi:uncharacterized phage protein (TIGR02218 family)
VIVKTAGAALISLLNAQQFISADLYTFTLASGTIYRYTNADGDLTSGGFLFSSAGPTLSRGRTRIVIGVEVDTLAISFGVNSSVLIGTIPVAQFAAQGGFDGARVKLERVFMPLTSWGDTSAGTLIMFVGRVAEVQCTRSGVAMNVNSDLELLNVMLPRNLYQAGCVHSLFDTGCTLLKASYAAAGTTTAAAGSTAKVLNCALTAATGWFDLGTVTFTGGLNTGVSRTVKSQTLAGTDTLTLSNPLPYTPTVGDAFIAYPGCAKTSAICDSKFANKVNFRGFETIPAPETSY